MKKNVLIVEDDWQLAQLLRTQFEKKSHNCETSHTIFDAYSQLESKAFDLVLLDRVLPDGDGLELAKYLRDCHFQTKIIILSHQHHLEERIRGLEEGADDYMPKPFSLPELLIKSKKLLQIVKHPPIEEYNILDALFYPDSGLYVCKGKELLLRPKESAILTCLLRARPSTISREKIIDAVWTITEDAPNASAIDVYIRRLRVALGKSAHVIKTVRGFGYCCL
ncbi:MAG: response regulator transcription factor [Microgenomates group bacterium]